MFKREKNKIIDLLAAVSNLSELTSQGQLLILLDGISPKERLIALNFLLRKNYYRVYPTIAHLYPDKLDN